MDEEVECDICGKGIAAVAVYSGDVMKSCATNAITTFTT
ncbi:Uncharacterised protein [Cronobacter sakazakii]|nr:Uncharacterised protein [Cronobacter sakazakii]